MGGTVRGVVNGRTNGPTEFHNTGDVFKVWHDAITAHPITTRVALQYGFGGTGLDFWDGVNPLGSNCFAVWRINPSAARSWPYYLLLQATGGTAARTFGITPGDPGDTSLGNSSSTAYIGIGVAIGIGGDLNPWNGTTNNDGTDLKGGASGNSPGADGTNSVWRTPVGGTGLVVLPRANNGTGADATAKSKLIGAGNFGNVGQVDYHLVMDDDNFFFHSRYTGTGTDVCVGLLDPIPALSMPYPLVAFVLQNFLDGTSLNAEQSGVVWPDPTDPDPVRQILLRYPGNFGQATEQPNNVFSPPQYDMTPIVVVANENPNVGAIGHFGSSDQFFRYTYNCPRDSASLTRDRAVFGTSNLTVAKVCVPWDGVSIPTNGPDRNGVTF